MFDNPGTKIKKFVKTVYIIEVVLPVVATLSMLFFAMFSLFAQRMEFKEGLVNLAAILIFGLFLVLVVFFATAITLWFPTILLYGFGEMIERLGRSDDDEHQDGYNEVDDNDNGNDDDDEIAVDAQDDFYDMNSVIMPDGCSTSEADDDKNS